jgi:hypothetical protein
MIIMKKKRGKMSEWDLNLNLKFKLTKAVKLKKDKSRKNFSLVRNVKYALQYRSWNGIGSGVV